MSFDPHSPLDRQRPFVSTLDVPKIICVALVQFAGALLIAALIARVV
jgi:hypothetical protein